MSTLIYLDYLATTPVDPRVAEVMSMCLTLQGDFGNAASHTHRFGFDAKARIQTAREQVACLIQADPQDIIWTSGATESINLALKGAALFYQRQGKHIITLSTEHKAVLDTCRYLHSIGFDVTYLNPEKNGLLDLEKLKKTIRRDTILASIMHVNNETGVIQDITTIGTILREKGVLLHVDAAQSVGKIPIDMKTWPVDLLSFTAHKIYGPKGVGALFVRSHPRVQLVSQMHGGDLENHLRAGTLPTHQIVGMGKACELMQTDGMEEAKRIAVLRDQLWKNISVLDGMVLNGDVEKRVCGCLNFSVDGVDGELLVKSLYDLAISTGSACNSANPEPSHVLLAMGLTRDQAHRSLRIGIGRFTTKSDIEHASYRLIEQIRKIRIV